MAWWVTYTDGRAGTVELAPTEYPPKVSVTWNSPDWATEWKNYTEALNAKVLEAAAELGPVLTIAQLPYPASPVLRRRSSCPEFCHQPTKCAGRSSCPREYACDD